jgi:hypothetical protein
VSKATARGRAGSQRAAAPRSGTGKGTASRNGKGGAGGWGGSLQLGTGGEPALLPEGTVDAQADIDSILELQRSHGNRVVVQLIAAAEGAASVDLGGRADRLVRAIKFELPWWTIDVPSAAGALDGLGSNDVMALSREVERRLDISLSLIVSKARISDAERKQLRTLMQGSGVDRFEGREVRQVGEAAGAFIGNLANALGADIDPELAGKVSGAAFEATARATYDAERPEAEAAAATRRFYARAHDVRALMGRSDKERLFALIGGSHQDRMALADAYAKEYGTSLYNDLTTKLSGKEKDRFQALWAGDKVGAETAALEAETEQRKKAEAEAEKAGPLLKLMGSDAAAVLEGKSAEARAKQERRVESLATAGALEDVLKRGGPKLEGVVEQDKILGFLRRGNVPEVMAMRLVRTDREGKLTQAMIEEALRSLRDEAELEAYRSVGELNLGPVVPLVTPLFVSGYYKRFEQEFDWQSAGGTTLRGILANAASATGVASWVTDPVLAERNQALIANGGYLPPWQELDFALRAKPKDMKTVRRVLGDLTPAELGLESTQTDQPESKAEPTTVAAEYKRKTNRTLLDDLMGTAMEQQWGATLRGGEHTVELGEKRLWIGARRFTPSATDEAGQIAEEGRWRFGRLAYYERLVMENRGSFAKARDIIGNLDKTLVAIAKTDAVDAKGAMERALLEHPPDLMEAGRQVTELRLIEQRLEANIAAYKQGTAEAWDEFVSFVAEVVTAIGTGGTSVGMSIARKAVMTAIKSALYTVGTKLVLDAENYSPAKLLADLRSAAGGALGGGLAERYVGPLADDLAKSVSAWAAKRGIAPGLAGAATEFIVKQQGEVFIGGITTALATGEDIQGLDPYSQLRGMAVSAGAGKVREGGAAVVKRVRRRKGKGTGTDVGETGEELTAATPAAGGEPGATKMAPASDETTPVASGAEIEDFDAEVEAEAPVVPMALPEPARPRGRAKPPPIPEAAKRRKQPLEVLDDLGPAEPGDFTDESDTDPDIRPEGDFESEPDTERDVHPPSLDPGRQGSKPETTKRPSGPEEDRIRKPGDPIQGPPEAFPPQDWDHHLVIQLKDATNHVESRNLLLEMFRQDPTREVGMYRNRKTGEYIVIQGEATKVGYSPKGAGVEQRWKEILEAHSDVGPWELVTHTHPRGKPYASGIPGDFGVIVREGLNSRTARTSEILFPTKDGMGRTEFGFNPDSDSPYWIKPHGYDEPFSFKTLPEYLAFIGDHSPVPDWMPRGRVDWSNRREMLKGMREWEAKRGIRPGEPSESPAKPGPVKESADSGEAGNAPVGTVGTDVPAGKSAAVDTRADITAEPNRPPSVPDRDLYQARSWDDFEMLERPKRGTSGSYRVRDKRTGQIYLFKPTRGERHVERAEERGIRKGEQAPRAKATEIAAEALGIETPDVDLVKIGTMSGSLTKWEPRQSLWDLKDSDPDLFQEIIRSPEFKQAQAGIDALDYLVNNLDRGQNFGNYLIELTPEGKLVSLVPIDHDLTFTSTGMRTNLPDWTRPLPYEYSPQMQTKLQELAANREAFIEAIRPLVGDAAIPGVERRLNELLKDMRDKQASKVRRAMARQP